MGTKASSNAKHERAPKYKVVRTPQETGFIPTLAVYFWLGWMGNLFYISLTLGLSWYNREILSAKFGIPELAISILCKVWTGTCVLSLALPRHFPGKAFGSHRMGNWMMRGAEKYFGLTTTFEDYESLKRNDASMIYTLEPHEMLPYSCFAFNPGLERFPRIDGSPATALMTSAVFNVPIMKHIYTWVGANAVDKRTFTRFLQKKKPICFIPGGVQEVLLIDPNKPKEIILYLKKRKGFIKLALVHGGNIVPMFSFGLHGGYNFWLPRGKLIEKLGRSIGFMPLIFWGRFFIPLGIPNPIPLNLVVGKPISIPKQENSEEVLKNIDKYHDQFVNELVALFERHKDENGYSEYTVKVM